MRRLDGSSSLTQPLVSRPGYGQGSPALPDGTVGESKLPEGPPADKGLSLDKDIPGTSTFNKPEGDIREPDKAAPGSIYRVDGPDGPLGVQAYDDPSRGPSEGRLLGHEVPLSRRYPERAQRFSGVRGWSVDSTDGARPAHRPRGVL